MGKGRRGFLSFQIEGPEERVFCKNEGGEGFCFVRLREERDFVLSD